MPNQYTGSRVRVGYEDHRFYVIADLHTRDAFGDRLWLVECKTCGDTAQLASRRLTNKQQKTCGCGKMSHPRYNQHKKFSRAYSKIFHRHYPRWDSQVITYDEFVIIAAQDCYLCGDPPNNDDGMTVYQGIDRYDNDIGYELYNCRPCCYPCNSMKSVFTEALLLDKVRKIAENRLGMVCYEVE